MISKGPEEPKGLMSAKTYREKVVMPFVHKISNMVKDLLGYAKNCIMKMYELEKKLYKVTRESDTIFELNKQLNKRLNYTEYIVEKQQKEIDKLEEDSKKLGFFKRYLKKSVYDDIIRQGEEEKDKFHSRESIRRK